MCFIVIIQKGYRGGTEMKPITQKQIEEMKKQTIGVEVEFTGITRKKAAWAVAKYFNTTPHYAGGGYKAWHIYDQQGRKWMVEYDSSVWVTNGGEQCELVTPILKYEDIETLQDILRALRKAGAVSRPSLRCGIHIHIGADGHDARTLRNLTNIMASHEDILAKAIQIPYDRLSYSNVTDARFLREVNKKKPKTMDELERIWYNGSSQSYMHYSQTRYHMLNLHSVFSKGTIEFRLFNFEEPNGHRRNGIHAGQIKAYIQLCLAMSQQAKAVKYASPNPVQQDNQKYALRTWMLRLHMIGPEFETARTLLMRNLNGNAAWRHTGPMADTNETA